jgi:UDP-N-acetylmuramate--alanine ligase
MAGFGRWEGRSDGEGEVLEGADEIFWLPTYLSREDEGDVILPEEFIGGLVNGERARAAGMDGELAGEILRLRGEGYLILLMSAGRADGWLWGVIGAVG